MSKKIINITAAAMALAVTLSGCATAVVQERKDQAAAAASAEAAQAAVTATPEPTAEPTPEPINAWSLLSNLPDFTPGTLDNPDTTWPDGIPMGQSPLSYDDGSKFYSLRSVDTGKTLDITDVALQDVRDLPVKGYLKLNELENGDTVIGEINAESTGEGVEKEISDFSIHTASKDDGCDYYPIGYNGGSLTLMLDGRAANDDGINIGDAFLDGLYYSSVTPDKFDGYPTDGEPEEQFNFLYGLFGNPSGLYWTNNDSQRLRCSSNLCHIRYYRGGSNRSHPASHSDSVSAESCNSADVGIHSDAGPGFFCQDRNHCILHFRRALCTGCLVRVSLCDERTVFLH